MAKHMSGEDEIEMEVETELKKAFETKVNTEAENVVEATIKTEVKGEVEPKFTKEQLLNSKKYSNSKDILTALLTKGECYTHSEISRITEEFLKGEIK